MQPPETRYPEALVRCSQGALADGSSRHRTSRSLGEIICGASALGIVILVALTLDVLGEITVERDAASTIVGCGGDVCRECLLPKPLAHSLRLETLPILQRITSVSVGRSFWVSQRDQNDELIGGLKKLKHLRTVFVVGPSRISGNGPPRLDLAKLNAALPEVAVGEAFY